jgi:hypothetical protein
MGCRLSSGNTVFDSSVEPRKNKHSLLPLLTVLFVISYSLMVMLVIEQGSTITSQGWLIKQLFADSTELTTIKSKALQDKHTQAQSKAQAQTQAQGQTKEQSQDPSVQVPSHDRASGSRKLEKSLPQHPPKPASDSLDARRVLRFI